MAPVASNNDEEITGYDAMTGFGAQGGAAPATFRAIPRPPEASSSYPFQTRVQARDGNCLFRSFSDQVYGTPDHHALVRDRCSRYIASERNYFEQFVTEPFDQFLDRMCREGEWGDDVEIEALSEIYDCRVEIYAPYSQTPMRTFHETCDGTWPSPIRLQYEGHSHYNSLALRTGFAPIAKSMPGRQCAPGDIENAAIARSQKRQEAGQRRRGAAEADVDQTNNEVLDESIRLSRVEFEHKSDAEMDKALDDSKAEWERAERKRMDDEVVETILQQSVIEEEQKQLSLAMKESKALNFAAFAGAAASSSAGADSENRPDSKEYQYPESVYAVMSMGFPLDRCIQAYHLVGDNPEGILAFCCQNLGR